MKLSLQMIFVSMFLLCLHVGVYAQNKQDPKNFFGKVTKIEGKVIIIRKLKKQNVTKGMELYHRDVIRTSADSTVDILISEGNEIHVNSNSRVKINRNDKTGTVTADYSVAIEKGALRCKLDKFAGNKMNVKTPVAVVGVRGTDFIVNYNPALEQSKVYSVSVIEGQVDVTSLIKVDDIFQNTVLNGKQRVYVSDQGTLDKIKAMSPQELDQLQKQFTIEETKVAEPKQDATNNTNNNLQQGTNPGGDNSTDNNTNNTEKQTDKPDLDDAPENSDSKIDSDDYVDEQFEEFESSIVDSAIEKASEIATVDIEKQIEEVNEEILEEAIEETLENTKKDLDVIRLRLQFQLED